MYVSIYIYILRMVQGFGGHPSKAWKSFLKLLRDENSCNCRLTTPNSFSLQVADRLIYSQVKRIHVSFPSSSFFFLQFSMILSPCFLHSMNHFCDSVRPSGVPRLFLARFWRGSRGFWSGRLFAKVRGSSGDPGYPGYPRPGPTAGARGNRFWGRDFYSKPEVGWSFSWGHSNSFPAENQQVLEAPILLKRGSRIRTTF